MPRSACSGRAQNSCQVPALERERLGVDRAGRAARRSRVRSSPPADELEVVRVLGEALSNSTRTSPARTSGARGGGRTRRSWTCSARRVGGRAVGAASWPRGRRGAAAAGAAGAACPGAGGAAARRGAARRRARRAACACLRAGGACAWRVEAAAPARRAPCASCSGLAARFGLLLRLLRLGDALGASRPRAGAAAGASAADQQRDEREPPAPHPTSAGRANEDALGMIPAASTSSHCSSSEQ